MLSAVAPAELWRDRRMAKYKLRAWGALIQPRTPRGETDTPGIPHSTSQIQTFSLLWGCGVGGEQGLDKMERKGRMEG